MKYYTYIYAINGTTDHTNFTTIGTLSARSEMEALGFAMKIFTDNHPNYKIVNHSVKLMTSIPDNAFIENGMLVYKV